MMSDTLGRTEELDIESLQDSAEDPSPHGPQIVSRAETQASLADGEVGSGSDVQLPREATAQPPPDEVETRADEAPNGASHAADNRQPEATNMRQDDENAGAHESLRAPDTSVPQKAGKTVVGPTVTVESVDFPQQHQATNLEAPRQTVGHPQEVSRRKDQADTAAADTDRGQTHPTTHGKNVENLVVGKPLAEAGDGDDRPPAGDEKTASDNPDDHGREALVGILGESAPELIRDIDSTRASVLKLAAITKAPNPFNRPSNQGLELNPLPDSQINKKQLARARKVLQQAEAGPGAKEPAGFFAALIQSGEEEAWTAHNTIVEIAKEALDCIRTVPPDPEPDDTDQQQLKPHYKPEDLWQQAELLSLVSTTIPSRRLSDLVVRAYADEMALRSERGQVTKLVPLPSAQIGRTYRKWRLEKQQEAMGLAEENLADSIIELREVGKKAYELVRERSGAEIKSCILPQWFNAISRTREQLVRGNIDAITSTGIVPASLLDADRYLGRQLEDLKIIARSRGIGSQDFKDRVGRLENVSLDSILNKARTERLAEQSTTFSQDVTLAGRVLKGGKKLGDTKLEKDRAAALSGDLMGITEDIRGRTRLFTEVEAGVLVAIDQGKFNKFVDTVSRITAGDPGDEDLAYLRGQNADAVRPLSYVQLQDLLEGLEAKLANRDNRIVISGVVSRDRLVAFDSAISGYLHPQIDVAETEATLAELSVGLSTETLPDEHSAGTPAEGTAQISEPDGADVLGVDEQSASAEDALDPNSADEPEITVTDDEITIGTGTETRVFPKATFRIIDPRDLRPATFIGSTILPDEEFFQRVGEQNWDAIDRAIDEITSRAYERLVERAVRRKEPIPDHIEADPHRIDVLRLIAAVWEEIEGPDSVYYTLGSLDDKRRYVIDGEEQVDEYIVLVLRNFDADGQVKGEHAIAETPLKGKSAMYVKRYDTPGYTEYDWSDVFAVPRVYARFFGARPLRHVEREDEDIYTTMFKKAMAVLLCRAGAFKQLTINQIERELNANDYER